jgi:hypothetical protein
MTLFSKSMCLRSLLPLSAAMFLAACEGEATATGPDAGVPEAPINQVVTFGPLNASSPDTLVFFSFAKGTLVPRSGDWDLAFRRFEVRLNSPAIGGATSKNVLGVALDNNRNATDAQVLALTIGGAIGGLGGGLLVHQFNFIDVQSTGVLFSIYVLLYVLMGGTQTVWGPLFGAVFFTLVPEALRKLSTIDPSLKFLEGGRYIVFGVAVVLIMMLRPQGVITRTMIERWTSPGRRKQEASV